MLFPIDWILFAYGAAVFTALTGISMVGAKFYEELSNNDSEQRRNYDHIKTLW